VLGDTPELAVAAAAEDDDLALATLFGDRAGSGQGLNAGRGGEAVTVVTELGEERWSQELADAGQGIEDEGIGMLGEELSERGEGFGAAENLRQQEFSQDADLVPIGLHGDRVGLWGWIHQVGVAAGDEVRPGIAMFSAESLKSR